MILSIGKRGGGRREEKSGTYIVPWEWSESQGERKEEDVLWR